MVVRLISAPLTMNDRLKVVSVQELMAHARISSFDETLPIAEMLVSAYDFLADPNEGWLNGCVLLNQDFEVALDVRPDDYIDYPIRPFFSAEPMLIEYRNGNGDFVTLDPESYSLRYIQTFGLWRIYRRSYTWPWSSGTFLPGDVRLSYTAGFGTEKKDIPPKLRQAIKMLAGHWFGQRETTGTDGRTPAGKVPFGLNELAGRHRFSPDHS